MQSENTNSLEKLAHKKRSIDDLVRYIKTKPGQISNFSLFLGAGCSITSGIRSATELSNIWLKEIYSQQFSNEENDLKVIRERLKTDCRDWYNPNHEYSCLFEKRYDLPSQRRAFIEEEVANKFPSLGYAYLIKLIEYNYFNTIFTTNFDDLLNESFHLFADSDIEKNKNMSGLMRPILCAHDSSVKGISITSMRPKIIKLHGDFLFEDIKSTLIETESLEENTKNKIVEFCKEYGLIVIGYSGNDRSVMDIINYLLKNDDFLKNGLYWCHKKGEPISDELYKLLWKDRVYFVEIDGFDELFAELYEKINPTHDELPLPQTLPNKANLIIEKLSNNRFLLESKSPIIKNALEKLNREIKKNSFFNNIKDVLFPDGKLEDFNGFSSDETRSLFEIDHLENLEKFDEALKKINENLASPDISFPFKQRLRRSAAHILRHQNKYNEAIKYCDLIIEDSKHNPHEYFFKNNFLIKYEDKIDNLRKCITKHPNFYKAYESIAKYESQILAHDFQHQDEILLALADDLDNGIKCNPYLENDCYEKKFSSLIQLRKKYTNSWYDDAEQILKIAESQNPNHPLVFNYKIELIKCHHLNDKLATDHNYEIDQLNELWDELYAQVDNYFDIYIGQCLSLLSEDIIDQNKIDNMKSLIENNEFRLRNQKQFVSMFSQFYAQRIGNVSKALSLWENIPEEDYTISDLKNFMAYYEILNQRDDFEKLLKRIKYNKNSRFGLRLELLSAENIRDYDKVINIIQKLECKQLYNNEFFTQKMYTYLCKGDFDKVYSESQAILKDPIAINEINSCDIINYEISRLKRNKTLRKEKIAPIISSECSKAIKAAAHLLLNQNEKANKIIETDIKFDYLSLHTYNKTYIFNEFLQKDMKDKIKQKLEKVK